MAELFERLHTCRGYLFVRVMIAGRPDRDALGGWLERAVLLRAPDEPEDDGEEDEDGDADVRWIEYDLASVFGRDTDLLSLAQILEFVRVVSASMAGSGRRLTYWAFRKAPDHREMPEAIQAGMRKRWADPGVELDDAYWQEWDELEGQTYDITFALKNA